MPTGRTCKRQPRPRNRGGRTCRPNRIPMPCTVQVATLPARCCATRLGRRSYFPRRVDCPSMSAENSAWEEFLDRNKKWEGAPRPARIASRSTSRLLSVAVQVQEIQFTPRRLMRLGKCLASACEVNAKLKGLIAQRSKLLSHGGVLFCNFGLVHRLFLCFGCR